MRAGEDWRAVPVAVPVWFPFRHPPPAEQGGAFSGDSGGRKTFSIHCQVIVKWLPCPVVSCYIALYHGHQQTQGVMQRRDTVRHGGIRLALPSGSSARKGVRVQIPPSAPNKAPMLFTRHPDRRFPMQYSVTYNAGPLSRLTFVSGFPLHVSQFL